MSSSRTSPPLRVASHGLFSWLPLCYSHLPLFSLQILLFLPTHGSTTSRAMRLELRGHDSRFPPSRCAIRGIHGDAVGNMLTDYSSMPGRVAYSTHTLKFNTLTNDANTCNSVFAGDGRYIRII